MGSHTTRFFHEHVLVKEPGTREVTPWHHDQPYYCVDGDQNVSFWVPLDPYRRSPASVRGRLPPLGSLVRPPSLRRPRPLRGQDDRFELVPDVDSPSGDHRILVTVVGPVT